MVGASTKKVNTAAIKDSQRERNEKKVVKDCIILDSYSGDENQDPNDKTGKTKKHVWWLLELPQQDRTLPRKIIKVKCGHSYDELQSIMGNAESQKGRKVSLHYTGYSDSDKSKGYAKAQIDHDAGMPDPAAQSTVMGIGFLAGMVDSDDILGKTKNLDYSPSNIGPTYKGRRG